MSQARRSAPVKTGDAAQKFAKNPDASGPDFMFETEAGAPRLTIAGVDEAGRGPLAGPVVAAAVVLNPGHLPAGINDSKKLTEARREALYDEILARAKVSVGIGNVNRIERMNILQATFWAMREALRGLPGQLDFALIDGNQLPRDLPCKAQAVVKGDARSLSIAAASIIAKVTRDRLMRDLAKVYPHYGWERNKGYGTAEHMAAIKRFGPCPEHRRTFAPIAQLNLPLPESADS